MNKLKIIFLTALGITGAIGLIYLLTAPSLHFYFANEGSVICTERKSWGIIDKGNTTCFRARPLFDPTPTPFPVYGEENGEVRLGN